MPMNDATQYLVVWGVDAERALASFKGEKFKINRKRAYRNALSMLAFRPREQAEGIVDYPGFEFNGYYWANINNAVVVYDVDEPSGTVFIDGCFYANYGESAEIFWGIFPDDDEVE